MCCMCMNMCVWEEGENVESKAFIFNNKILLIEYIESQLEYDFWFS